MKKIQCVTYPRSGHHLLTNLLISYYAQDPNTQLNSHDHFVSINGFQYCEFFNHCKTIPCTDPGTTYQKNHDLEMDQPINRQFDYVIQYRNPLESLVSYFNVSTIDRNWIKDEGIHSWKNFALENIKYWKKFASKWLNKNLALNAFYVNYGDLLIQPTHILTELIRYIDPDTEIDQSLIGRIIDVRQVKRQNTISDFKYFDNAFCLDLADIVKDDLERIGLTEEVQGSIG